MHQLKGSVGAAGVNRAEDVALVQRMLAAAGSTPGPVDSRCGRRTVSAIVGFQARFLHRPDGRIDVGGPTWRHLLSYGPARRTITPTPRPSLRSVVPPPASPVARPSALPPHPSATIRHPSVAIPRPHPTATSHLPEIARSSGDHVLRYRERLPLPPHDSINIGLSSPGNAEMLRRFGEPRQSYGTDCRPPTNERIKGALTSMQFGKTRVTGIAPAVESLKAIYADIEREQPDLVPHLGSAGMMCCRYQRGSNHAITNHSWGTAIDVAIDGQAEQFGERDVYLGLSLVGPIFNRHGWYWGAGYKRVTDCHHFECGSALLDSFRL